MPNGQEGQGIPEGLEGLGDLTQPGEEIFSPQPDLIESPVPVNLAENLDEDILEEMGRVVVDDYKNDLGSRSGLDSRLKIWFRLFSGLTEPKNHPWENCSNVNIPILSIACHQSHSRSYDALLPPKEIAKCVPLDGRAVDIATRRQKFLNWQLIKQMPEWKKDMDIMLLILPIYGSGVKKTYYDAHLKRNVSRTLRIDEFVAPYGVKNLDDAPRKTHIIEMSVNDIKIKGRAGIWINTEDISVNSTSAITDKPAQEHNDLVDKSIGLLPGADTKDVPRVVLEQHRLWDLDGDGIEEPYCITVDYDTGKVFSVQSLSYTDQAGEEQVYNYFTAYNFIPNPDSWMGFGFGHTLEHPNRSINSLTNQLMDAGTLANTAGGFINKTRNLKVGKLKFKMGQFTEVDLPSDDIRKSIFPFQFSQPSNVLFTLLGMLQDYSQKVSSVSDSMLGQLPPSDTTATTMLAVMEQGMKVFSTIHRRIHGNFEEELAKIETLNSIYVDEDTYRTVQDSTSEEIKTYSSAREDYDQPMDVMPTSDPSITSRAERLIRNRQTWELLKDDPDIVGDPEARYQLKLNLLEAMEVQNIDEILKKPEPPPEPPDLRPEEEESEFLAERSVAPLPQQDHEQHLISHQTFKEVIAAQPKGEEAAGAALIELSSQGKKLLDAHIKETMALLYLQQFSAATPQGDLQDVGGIPGAGARIPAGIPVEGIGTGVGRVGQSPGYEGFPPDLNLGEEVT